MDAPWRIELLGWLRATQGDRVVARFRSQRTGSLLAYLAYYGHRSHPREVLIELLWPERELEAGRNSFRVAISSLRRQLEPPGLPPGTVLVADRSFVRLNPAALITDVAEFEAALQQAARTTSAAERVQKLTAAVELYQGELLPGYYEAWILPERQRLAEAYFQGLSQLIGLIEQSGDLSLALQWARRAVAGDPLREEACHTLIRLLAVSGQAEAALGQYHELERCLAQELDTEPSPEIQALVRGIMHQRSGPTLPPPSPLQLQTQLHQPAITPRHPLLSGTVTFLLCEVIQAPGLGELSPVGASMSGVRASLPALFQHFNGHPLPAAEGVTAVAFGRASDALAAALAGMKAGVGGDGGGGRRAEALPASPTPVPLLLTSASGARLRMALHTGEAEPPAHPRDSPALRYATRLLLAAHPGQILLSEESAVLLRHELEPGQRLADLGLYRLRDGAPPERLYQIEYSGMAEENIPAPNAPAGLPGNLPLQFTRFFGREKDIARLREMLSPPQSSSLDPHPSRLVTLTGPGGTGKTRLALEVAQRLRERFHGSVWFVPLANLTDSRLIFDKMLDTLRLPRSPDEPPLEQVVAFLSQQPLLLLLDNFEHLVASAAPLVQTLRERVESLTLLVTSRQRLDLPGEQELPLEPLAVPVVSDGGRRTKCATDHSSLTTCESVRLFVDRAQAARPDFQITPSNAPAVAGLCRRLEGLPLALELAAARARMLTPAQMLARIEQRFELLVSRQREVDPRHRSLRAALDWSYQLLSPELQRFFARLSAFRGGWTLEAAEAVCGDPSGQDKQERLEELIGCSLVVAEESGDDMRYRLLETLQEYGAEQLAPEERAYLAGRHAEYYLSLAEQAEQELLGTDQGAWLERLEREHDNMRGALESCREAVGSEERFVEIGLRLSGALWGFWWIRGYLTEGRERLAELLASASPLERNPHLEAARGKALACAGLLAHYQGDYAAARALYEESLAIQRHVGDSWGMAFSLTGLGFIAEHRGDFEAVHAFQEEGLPIWKRLGNRSGIAWSLTNLGDVALRQGDYAQARTLFEESLAIRRELGDHWGAAFSLTGLGDAAQAEGDLTTARALFEEGLAIRRELGDRPGIAWALHHLGDLARGLGDLALARALYEECLALHRELGTRWGIATCLTSLANVAVIQGDRELARGLLAEGLALRESLGDREGAEECRASLARMTAALGQR